jgi:hypothetical protein
MSLDIGRTISELAAIEARYGGPVESRQILPTPCEGSLRAGRHRSASRYYFQAATEDRNYRSGDFLPDLFEVVQGVGRSVSNRIAGALTTAPPARRLSRPGRRYATQWAWVEQARPWIDELAAYRTRLLDPPHP